MVKTIHILRYLHDSEIRDRVQLQLNRGESRHALARRLLFANQGAFRSGDYEEVMNKVTALSVLSNAVLVWNTVRINEIVGATVVGVAMGVRPGLPAASTAFAAAPSRSAGERPRRLSSLRVHERAVVELEAHDADVARQRGSRESLVTAWRSRRGASLAVRGAPHS